MLGRVTIDDKTKFIGQALDWHKLVIIPAERGYFVEAYASADSLIDLSLNGMLRQLYSENKCQDLK